MKTFYLVKRNTGWVAQETPSMGTVCVPVSVHSIEEAQRLAEHKNAQRATKPPVVQMGRK